MKKSLLVVVGLLALAYAAKAITLNPASNTLADSANTASAIVMRDAAGSAQYSQIQLAATTTTQLIVTAPAAIGQLTVVSLLDAGATGSNYTLCVASGTTTGAWIYLSTNTTPGAGGSAKPRPCI